MKRFTQIVCLLLVFSVILTVPVSASESATSRGSYYFSSRMAYLHEISDNQFQIWIEVEAVDYMDKLGASEIVLQRSSDNSNWTDVKTFTKDSYTQLIRTNTTHHEAYVSYTGTPGKYYRAEVTFYAKKGSGEAEYSYTTESIKL